MPTEDRTRLILSDECRTEETYKRMAKIREDLFVKGESTFMTRSVFRTTVPGQEEGGTRSVIFENKDPFKDYFLTIARSHIIRTYEPDISNVMNALSHVDPSRFDFFPNSFTYGIPFLIVIGGVIKVLSLLKFLVVQNDLSYYLAHINDLAVMYVSMRGCALVVNLLTAWCLWCFSRLFFSVRISFFNAVAFLLMPTTVITTYIIKPHNFGALFILWMIYFLFRVCEREQKKKEMMNLTPTLVRLANPSSEEYNVMRAWLTPCLLRVLQEYKHHSKLLMESKKFTWLKKPEL